MTGFNRYAEYYDLLYRDKDYAGEAQFIDCLIRTNRPHAEKILDLGCGTGLHADFLAKAGYKVSGVDASMEMLHFANARKSQLTQDLVERLEFFYGDIRNIKLGEEFDVISSLFHVISYQTTNADLIAVLETVKTHLKPGGKFMFDFWYGPAVLSQRPTSRVKNLEDDILEICRIAEPTLYPNENRVDVNYDIAVTDKQTGQVENLNERHQMRYFFLPEVAAILELLDMKLITAREWMTDKEPGFDTWSVYAVAEFQ